MSQKNKNNAIKGRPMGAKNVATTQIVATPACPFCKSTERTKYRLVAALAYGGTTADGQPYTHVVTRRTCCKSCQKWRRDKFFENRMPAASPGEENEPGEMELEEGDGDEE